MRAPEGDPERLSSLNPVYDAMIAGQLTKADFVFQRNEFRDMRTPEGMRLSEEMGRFITAFRKDIERPDVLGQVSPSVMERAYFFEIDTRRKVEEYKSQGKNPYDLFSPAHPDSWATRSGCSNTRSRHATTIEQLDAWLQDFRCEEALSFSKADQWLKRFPLWLDETEAEQAERVKALESAPRVPMI